MFPAQFVAETAPKDTRGFAHKGQPSPWAQTGLSARESSDAALMSGSGRVWSYVTGRGGRATLVRRSGVGTDVHRPLVVARLLVGRVDNHPNG